MVETLSANTSDDSFNIWGLPRRMWRSDQLLDLHPFYSIAKFRTIYRITIPQQKTWCRVFWESFDHLLGCPGSGRMSCDIEMNDLSSVVQKDDEAVKVTKSGGGNCKKIDPRDLTGMIGKEGFPGLRWGLMTLTRYLATVDSATLKPRSLSSA
jgi:hypothetical protein